ncbi:hypothetical protein [Paraburkholderia sp. DHOC27]|uniref:hypothetical protein n=1 Tax=Paraburkholderia sp. DHOC27 TaxID=2303330 RepID=UPI000E3E4736|nr:hypothetical protein [Paraburkholderia sp. DHOC27]RFU45161.1 hypothetical protein D0B32_25840 [Paraburkholderia sp. DHOC27]
MFPFLNRPAHSDAARAHAAVGAPAIESALADTTLEHDAADAARPATYDELMPYLILAMAGAH